MLINDVDRIWIEKMKCLYHNVRVSKIREKKLLILVNIIFKINQRNSLSEREINNAVKCIEFEWHFGLLFYEIVDI